MWYNLNYPTDKLDLSRMCLKMYDVYSVYDGKSHAAVEINSLEDLHSLLNAIKCEVPDCIGIFLDGTTIVPKIEGDYN